MRMIDNDIQVLLSDNSVIYTKIVVLANETLPEMILTEEDSIKSWTHGDERYVPNVGFIGQFVSRTLSGELHNISDDFNIENREIELWFGIKQFGQVADYLSTEYGIPLITESGDELITKVTQDTPISWYKIGNYLITDPSDDEVNDNTKFDAMDYAILFNADFNASYVNNVFTESFADTIKEGGYFTALELAQYTCAQVDVEFGNIEFTNSNFIISSNQFTGGDSCRDVMKAISQLAHGWVAIGWDNKCYIEELETDRENIKPYNKLTYDNYYSLTTQKVVYGPINKILIGMKDVEGESVFIQDDESIELNGENTLAIYDNPITYTTALREASLNGAERLYGLEYTPIETETPGHPWLRGYELLEITDMEGNVKYTYAFNRTIKYTGHIKTELASVADTKASSTFAYRRSVLRELKDVKIQVDKQEGLITLLNSTTKVLEDGITTLEQKVAQTVTDAYTKTEIQEIISGVSNDGTVVSSVTTTAGTLDKNGLTIEQSEAETKTNINANGMIITSTTGIEDDDQLIVNSDGMIAKNVKIKTYLNVGEHSRMEDYTHTDGTNGTGMFWTGSD